MIKKIPLWGWIAIVIGVLFLMNYASSIVMNRNLFNIALDGIRKDQTQALQERDEQLNLVRSERELLKRQIGEVQKEKEAMRQRAIQSEQRVIQLEGENETLRNKISSIVVSDDPDRIIDDLNKAGFKSIKRKR